MDNKIFLVSITFDKGDRYVQKTFRMQPFFISSRM